MNINRSSGIHEQCACTTILGACCTDRHGTGIFDVDYTLPMAAIPVVWVSVVVSTVSVVIHIHGCIMVFAEPEIAASFLRI